MSESCKSLLTAFSVLTGLFLSTQGFLVGFLSFFMRGKIKRGQKKRRRNSGRKEAERGGEKETKEEEEGEEQGGIRGKTMILCLCQGKSHSKVSLPWLLAVTALLGRTCGNQDTWLQVIENPTRLTWLTNTKRMYCFSSLNFPEGIWVGLVSRTFFAILWKPSLVCGLHPQACFPPCLKKGALGGLLRACVPALLNRSSKPCSGWTTAEPLLWPGGPVCCMALSWVCPFLNSLEGNVE